MTCRSPVRPGRGGDAGGGRGSAGLFRAPPRRGDSYCSGEPGSRAAPQTSPHGGRQTGPPGERDRFQLRACPAACPFSFSPSAPSLRPGMPPNLTGYYRFVSQENMDNYLRALGNSIPLVPLLPPFFLPSVSKNVKSREREEGVWEPSRPSACDHHFCTVVGGGGGHAMTGAPWLKEWRSSGGMLLEEGPRWSTGLPSVSSSRYQRGPAKTGLPPEA